MQYIWNTIADYVMIHIQCMFGLTRLYADGSNIIFYYILYNLIKSLCVCVNISRFTPDIQYNNIIYGVYKNNAVYYYHIKNITRRELLNLTFNKLADNIIPEIKGGTIHEIIYNNKNITHMFTHLQNGNGLKIRDIIMALCKCDKTVINVTYDQFVMDDDDFIGTKMITKNYDVDCHITKVYDD